MNRKIEFDWTEWHPLDHRILGVACGRYHGGARYHFNLWWRFQSGMLLHPRRTIGYLRCRMGHHEPQPYWSGDFVEAREEEPSGYTCRWCGVESPGLGYTR